MLLFRGFSGKGGPRLGLNRWPPSGQGGEGSVDADSIRERILASQHPAVVVTLPGYEAVSFRTLTVGDLHSMIKKLDLPPVELAVEILAGQSENLPNATAVLRQLPRSTLLRLVRSWAAHPNTLDATPSQIRSFSDFKVIVGSKVDEWGHTMRELGQRLADQFSVPAAENQKIFSAFAEINRQLTEMLTKQKALVTSFNSTLSKFGSDARQLGNTIRMAELLLPAETLFTKTDWNKLSRDLVFSGIQVDLFQASEELTDRYNDLIASFSQPLSGWVSLPLITTALPSLEVFLAGDLAYSLGASAGEEEVESLVKVQKTRETVRGEVVASLDALLTDLDRNLIVPLSGARAALRSRNPDRPRHISASLRELFTHVLHRIAPDDAVVAWTKNPEHFQDGRPTRRARLLYVVSVVNHGPFVGFLESDVSAALKFLDVCQGGTHEAASPLTDKQLAAMVVRMEGLLRFLLEMWRLRVQ